MQSEQNDTRRDSEDSPSQRCVDENDDDGDDGAEGRGGNTLFALPDLPAI